MEIESKFEISKLDEKLLNKLLIEMNNLYSFGIYKIDKERLQEICDSEYFKFVNVENVDTKENYLAVSTINKEDNSKIVYKKRIKIEIANGNITSFTAIGNKDYQNDLETKIEATFIFNPWGLQYFSFKDVFKFSIYDYKLLVIIFGDFLALEINTVTDANKLSDKEILDRQYWSKYGMQCFKRIESDLNKLT